MLFPPLALRHDPIQPWRYFFPSPIPVFNECWFDRPRSGPVPAPQEGNNNSSGGGDNAARLYDIQTGQAQQVAQHDAPVKVVKWLETPQGSIPATGSWDKTIKVIRVQLSCLRPTGSRSIPRM